MARQVTGHREELTNIILLNRHNNKSTPTALLSDLQMHASLNSPEKLPHAADGPHKGPQLASVQRMRL